MTTKDKIVRSTGLIVRVADFFGPTVIATVPLMMLIGHAIRLAVSPFIVVESPVRLITPPIRQIAPAVVVFRPLMEVIAPETVLMAPTVKPLDRTIRLMGPQKRLTAQAISAAAPPIVSIGAPIDTVLPYVPSFLHEISIWYYETRAGPLAGSLA